MPMSASCVVNRGEVLALIDEVRELLPEEFRQAEAVLRDRDAVLEAGRREAERQREIGRQERGQLVTETEVLSAAYEKAEGVRQAALVDAEMLRREVDDYVETKLATFEVVLDKTLLAVQRGREKLRGRQERAELADLDSLADEEQAPLP